MCLRCRVAAAVCGLAAAGHVAVAPLLRRTQAALDSRLCHCGRAAGRHRWRARLTGTLGWRLGPAPWTGGLDWHLASQPLHGASRKGRLPGRAPAASQSQPTQHCCTLSTPFLSDTDAALPTVHHCPGILRTAAVFTATTSSSSHPPVTGAGATHGRPCFVYSPQTSLVSIEYRPWPAPRHRSSTSLLWPGGECGAANSRNFLTGTLLTGVAASTAGKA